AKQMRRYEEDLPHWRAALDADTSASRQSTARMHRVEAWRDRLLREGDVALGDLLAQHPGADRQHLRTLLRQAQSEHARGKPPATARLLFRALRELLAPGADAPAVDI
ncbi:MAG: ribosome biogenesis factor YjgA, partial [Lysobacterales bacterium]